MLLPQFSFRLEKLTIGFQLTIMIKLFWKFKLGMNDRPNNHFVVKKKGYAEREVQC